MFDCWYADTGNRHSGLVDTLIHFCVKAEPHARQVQAIVGGTSGEKSSGTDSHIIQAALDGIVNFGGGARRQAVADGDEVSAWNNQQPRGHEFCFAHAIQLPGIRGGIFEVAFL